MIQSEAIETRDATVVEETARARPMDWSARLIMVGAVSIVAGILWDISWHRTIGRDSFWTPAHMAIYLGGVLGGCIGGWLAFQGTFLAAPQQRGGMVSILGLRAPFGAWLCIWGAIAMLTSAPFDDWWHNAYGLDVKILSPPHTVLALGMWAIVWGALFLVLREQNAAARAMPVRWFVILAGGILITMASVFHIEESWPNQQRSARFYLMSSVVYPMYLTALAQGSRFRFGATMIAAVYMLIMMLQGWLFPLFPGQPKLGPVYNPVTHFVPLAFPLILVVPALGIDLMRWIRGQKPGWWRDWLLAVGIAIAFTGLFFVTQWLFSGFLITEKSHNRFFFGDLSWGYTDHRGPGRSVFWGLREGGGVSLESMLKALLIAFCSSRIGIWFGRWLAAVKR